MCILRSLFVLFALAIGGCGTSFYAIAYDTNGHPLPDAEVTIQTSRFLDVLQLKQGSSKTDSAGRTKALTIEQFQDGQSLLIHVQSGKIGEWYTSTGSITTPLSPTDFKLRQLVADQVDEADRPTITLWSKN